MRRSGTDLLTRRRLAWAAVLAANLPTPLWFGHGCTRDGGRVGMLAGVGLIWFLGHVACRYQPRLASVVIPGGWFVAPTQVWPILHVLAGTIAVWAASLGARQAGGLPQVSGDARAFTATLLTAGMLLTVAVVCGLLFRLVFPDGQLHDPGKPKTRPDELA